MLPNTPANVTIVTACYDRWQSLLYTYKNYTPDPTNPNKSKFVVTKADVDAAYKKMQAAIREWEKPGSGETSKQAKADRKAERKFRWPKFK